MAGIKASELKGKITRVHFSGINKTLNLKFNLNALYFLEQEYGDINKALEEIKDGKIKSLISITAAALSAGKNRKEPFTDEEVADMVQVDDLEPLSKALEEMMGGKDESTPSNVD